MTESLGGCILLPLALPVYRPPVVGLLDPLATFDSSPPAAFLANGSLPSLVLPAAADAVF